MSSPPSVSLTDLLLSSASRLAPQCGPGEVSNAFVEAHMVPYVRSSELRVRRARPFKMAWVAAAVVAWSCSGDSGGPTASPTPTSPPGPNTYRFELLKVQANRWSDTGYYEY